MMTRPVEVEPQGTRVLSDVGTEKYEKTQKAPILSDDSFL